MVRVRDRDPERGMVTVETAFALVALAVALSLCIAVAGALFALGQCQVAANEIARQAARGDTAAAERATADAPRGAVVTQRREAGTARVEVAQDVLVGPVVWPVRAVAVVIEE